MIIIGAAKCGTTALHYYLSQHPEIQMSVRKELRFFVKELNWNRGLKWYKSHFTSNAKIYGESSPAYSNRTLFSGVAERIAQVIPDAKLIYLVRDPLPRLVSQYYEEQTHNRANLPLNEWILRALDGDDARGCLSRARYFWQISAYLDHFDRSQMLILKSDDLYHQRLETLQKIFMFLGVDPTFKSPHFWQLRYQRQDKRRKNRLGVKLEKIGNSDIALRLFPSEDFRREVGKILYLPVSKKIKKQAITDGLRQRLIDYYRDDLIQFQQLTGLDLSHWSIFSEE